MPCLSDVLHVAGGVFEHLPVITAVVTTRSDAVPALLSAHGYAAHTVVPLTAVTDLLAVRALTSKRRICGDCRLIVLDGTSAAPQDVQRRLVAAIDRAVGTSRFVCVVPRISQLIPKLRSRAVVVRPWHTAPPRKTVPQGAALQRGARKAYASLAAAGASQRRLDIAVRAALKRLGELAIATASVGLVLRAVARAALDSGDAAAGARTLRLATTCAHSAARAPQNELVCLHAFLIELVAGWPARVTA